MKIHTMDLDMTLRLLEGHKDELAEEGAIDDRFVRGSRCPACGGYRMTKEFDPDRPFSPGRLLPNFRMRCSDCDRSISMDGTLIVEDGARSDSYDITK